MRLLDLGPRTSMHRDIRGTEVYREILEFCGHVRQPGTGQICDGAHLAAEHRSPADLKVIANRQREFEGTLKRGNYLDMSEANKNFHMAIADASRNPYLSGFYERLLTQGRRMLHMHFEYLKKPTHGHLLTDEHDDMLSAIKEKNAEQADKLAHEHTRQFRDQFLEFMKKNYINKVSLAAAIGSR